MDKEHIIIKMKNMKDNLKMTNAMVMEFILIKMEIDIKAIGKKI
jgi:hypothetical protein